MANYERGVYEPSDEVRVFDGSEDDDDIEGSRLPLLIVLALLVLAMFGGVVWLAYTQGVARGRGETPVLAAAAGPERVAPPAGGGNVPYQGFKIYEQPAPSDDVADSAPPPKPAAAAEAPAPAQNSARKRPPAPPPAAAKANSVATLIQQANGTPPPAKLEAKPETKPETKPAARQAAKPVVPAMAVAATGAPRALAAPVPAATKPPAAKAASAPTGGYVLQIGAYKSQADADSAWVTYKAKHAALLSGYAPDVQQADLGEKGTWYRLRVAGFGDRDVASGVCDRLKADGGACILTK
ncbi:MAG TPA: SPOR domain-containing protein [Rhizomicrobium sp.]|nr:SPOR domain-containing protein [Rhizomicrobium sp.]